MPKISVSTPRPRSWSAPVPEPAIPPAKATAPAPVMARPKTVRFSEALVSSMAVSRSAAMGLMRLALRAGPTEAKQRHRDADHEGRDDRAGRDDHVTARDVEADRSEERPQPERHAHAGRQADGRGDRADDHRLQQHRSQHLPAAGADGSEHRHLPHALGDDDREGVVDDEHADEQRDVGEGQEERVEEAHVLLERRLLVGGVGVAREDLEVVGSDGRLRWRSPARRWSSCRPRPRRWSRSCRAGRTSPARRCPRRRPR